MVGSSGIISVHVGQCGLQLGSEFWKRLIEEQQTAVELTNDGVDTDHDLKKEVFFRQSSNGHYTPRALLLDLEPRVINSLTKSRLFETAQAHHGKDGTGNIWTSGYHQGRDHSETIVNMIQHEVERTDSFQGFLLCHSIAGGTGSGLGSYLLETLNDEYSQKNIQTYSVFPDMENSDVVVSPYNATLALKGLVREANAVVILDNSELKSNDGDWNDKFADVMAGTTSPLRFKGPTSDMVSIISNLTSPVSNCHFLSTSLSQARVNTHNISSPSFYISILKIIRGNEMGAALGVDRQQLYEDNTINFVPRMRPRSIKSVSVPALPASNTINSFTLANHTGIARSLDKLLNQCDRLTRKQDKGAFFWSYEKDWEAMLGDGGKDIGDELTEAKEEVTKVVNEYRQMEQIV